MASGKDVEEVVLSMSKASIQVEVKEGDGKKIDRYCAFCLTLVPWDKVKTCSKCKRRAYCSKECQKADWTQKGIPPAPASNGKICGYGQGHKNWCGLPYGEEDLDWKVVPISGKGLGIVALRDIPYLFRIIVEGMQPQPEGNRYSEIVHPAMNDIHPPNSNMNTKFSQNSVMSVLLNGMRVGLRLARINHSCRPNAAYTDDPNFPVFVLCAEREIKAGEEICRSYLQGMNFPFQYEPNGGLTYKTPEQCREEYSSKWGIVCPPSCPCKDEKNAKLLEELKELGEYCVTNPLKKPALQKSLKVIENAKEFGVGAEYMANFYLSAFELAVTRRETLVEAKKYFQTAMEIMAAVHHPIEFSQVKDKSVLPDMTKHPQYLAAER